MNILEKIVAHKQQEVAACKERRSIAELEKIDSFERDVLSLSEAIRNSDPLGIISEIKRASPSTGAIKENVDVATLSQAYIEAGASALSILTDYHFFGGRNEDLQTARANNQCPILRKDFIIDEYQIIEAKSIGADCILLIAACLEPILCKTLASTAHSLGLEVLLEVHKEEEIESHFNSNVNLIGVNNRNLKSFKTSIENSLKLYDSLPKDVTKISESGISTAAHLKELKQSGYDGFLIGGHFMKTEQPALSCKELIEDFKSLAL